MASEKTERYCYVYSCDLREPLRIKIGSLEGHNLISTDSSGPVAAAASLACPDLIVTCEVASNGKTITLPIQTSYKSFTQRLNWQEWLTLPIAYCDLPRNAELVFHLLGLNRLGETFHFGQTSIPVFTRYGTVHSGMFDLKITEVKGDEADESERKGDSGVVKFLAELTKKHREGRIEKIDWLDRLTFREIEHINDQHKRVSKLMYLMVAFPEVVSNRTQFDIVYFEKDADKAFQMPGNTKVVRLWDSYISVPNLIENKHHLLARTLRSGTSDRDMKPDLETRDNLNRIVSSPPTKMLTSEEQDLLWKYRYFLSSQKLALTKFLKCVNWHLEKESREAIELMNLWEPISFEDSLELLSPNFTTPEVRQYAVGRLMQADDEELLLYLLQLVQAIRYEDVEQLKSGLLLPAVTSGVTQDVLDEALVAEGILSDSFEPEVISDDVWKSHDQLTASLFPIHQPGQMDVCNFLIFRSSSNFTLANYLYWYLRIEAEEVPAQTDKSNEIFSVMLQRFTQALKKHNPSFFEKLTAQQGFVDKLLRLTFLVTQERVDRKKKIERLQNLLRGADDFGKDFRFTEFAPFPLPLDPSKIVKGVIPEEAYLFKSALCPARLTFVTTSEEHFSLMFKSGDDLRQDQLVLQMIHLMDRLLRKENLDLKLKPYRVLATGSRHGFIEFVASSPVAEILAQNDSSILSYLRKQAPAENVLGIRSEVMDTYIRSCAGYCVITYLLGVGDRHLDNLMLTPTGHLFHIDFGYILGRDPKPMPPPMKLTKEMVDAMGGPGSEYYKIFTDLCFSAFFHLRRSANLILNLFSLMVDANIPDIVLEPDKTVKKVQDKFLLNLSDEEAAKEMQNLLEMSVSALMPAIAETFHRFAQVSDIEGDVIMSGIVSLVQRLRSRYKLFMAPWLMIEKLNVFSSFSISRTVSKQCSYRWWNMYKYAFRK